MNDDDNGPDEDRPDDDENERCELTCNCCGEACEPGADLCCACQDDYEEVIVIAKDD